MPRWLFSDHLPLAGIQRVRKHEKDRDQSLCRQFELVDLRGHLVFAKVIERGNHAIERSGRGANDLSDRRMSVLLLDQED